MKSHTNKKKEEGEKIMERKELEKVSDFLLGEENTASCALFYWKKLFKSVEQ